MNQIGPDRPLQNPQPLRRMRILGILLGGCLFVWLQLEGSGELWVLLFSAAISVLTATQVWLRLTSRFGMKVYWLPLAGFLAGLLITPAALLMMAMKTGLHGHQGPDFSGEQILAIVRGTPAWLISGLLVGIGLQLFFKAKYSQSPRNKQL